MLAPAAPPIPMPAAGSAFAQLHQHLHHNRLLGSISSALYYDQNTVMPAAGAAWRGEQLALLASQLHEHQSSAVYAELVAAAEVELGADAPPACHRNLQLLRLELDRQRCLDPDLVAALARAQSRGNAVWQDARSRNDFAAFAPALQELISLRRQQASQLAAAEPVPRSPWEILAQPFEPDISKARLEELFTPLKAELPVLLEQAATAAASNPTESAGPAAELPEALQEQLCAELLDSWGYDPARCDVVYDARCSPDFYGWVFPHGDTLSIGTGSADKGFSLRAATARLRADSGMANAETVRREGAPLPMRPLRKWDNGRDVVLAGDAAGVVAPASGEGIYYALLGGQLAGEAAAELLRTGDGKALAQARKRFMKAHGTVFRVLGIMQWFWYRNDRLRERFVKICEDVDVQRLTFESYMNKELVRRKPMAHVRIFFKDLAHLLGLARV